MLKKLMNMKKKKGFTLIELIVVLVIMAILAAAAIPTMMGYVDKARASQHLAEGRSVYVAATAACTEAYGKGDITAANNALVVDYTAKASSFTTEPAKTIYEMTVNGLGVLGKATISHTAEGQVTKVIYNTVADGKSGYIVTLTFNTNGTENSAEAKKV